jgi:hypothetical protein
VTCALPSYRKHHWLLVSTGVCPLSVQRHPLLRVLNRVLSSHDCCIDQCMPHAAAAPCCKYDTCCKNVSMVNPAAAAAAAATAAAPSQQLPWRPRLITSKHTLLHNKPWFVKVSKSSPVTNQFHATSTNNTRQPRLQYSRKKSLCCCSSTVCSPCQNAQQSKQCSVIPQGSSNLPVSTPANRNFLPHNAAMCTCAQPSTAVKACCAASFKPA